MSASSSAGTSLKLNGETSLHMPKALAMPRRVSLALIKLVGKESNLLGERQHYVVNTGLYTHSSTQSAKTQWLLFRADHNSHKRL